jgi:hypothetical protein
MIVMQVMDLYEREALHREILAAIAAGRELSPDLDSHLADAALDRYVQEAAGRGYRPWQAVRQPMGSLVVRVITRLAVLATVIVVMGMILFAMVVMTVVVHLQGQL